ncbi:hypothetical protein RFUL19S_05248 [Rhizobacter fulvus]
MVRRVLPSRNRLPASPPLSRLKALVFAAQTQAQAAMKTAALDLADLIRTDILGKGGKYVAVTTC